MELRDDAGWRGHRAVLHEEISRLPPELRMAIILCDLGGHSTRSTAEQLGWPVGRLDRRLARARAHLRSRMARHGVFLPARGFAEWLRDGEPAVPRRLIEATVLVATRRSGRRGQPPWDYVAELTRAARTQSPDVE